MPLHFVREQGDVGLAFYIILNGEISGYFEKHRFEDQSFTEMVRAPTTLV